MRLRPSDYYTFLATAMSLDEKTVADKDTTIRDKYLHHVAYDKPVPEFASAFAVQMTLVTSDGYIVVSTRETEGIVGYPGHLAPRNQRVREPSRRSWRQRDYLFAHDCETWSSPRTEY